MGNLYLSGPVPVEVVTPRGDEGKAADALAAKSRSGGDIPEMSQQSSRILAAIKQSNEYEIPFTGCGRMPGASSNHRLNRETSMVQMFPREAIPGITVSCFMFFGHVFGTVIFARYLGIFLEYDPWKLPTFEL